MHLDYTRKTAMKKHNRRVAIAFVVSVCVAVMSVWEVAMLIKVGVL